MAASTVYDSLSYDVAAGAVVPATDTLKVLLVFGYTPNAKTHTRRSDVTGEVVGTGYTAGGQVLAGVAATLDTVNDWTLLTATNPVWSAATITATGAVVYKSRGGAASLDNLVSYIDFGGTISSTNAPFTGTTFSTNGFLKLPRI